MSKLIEIELKKIFKHKSIYIILSIILIFCFLNNILYKLDYDADGNYKYEDNIDLNKYIKELEKELKKYDFNIDSDKNIYITTKTKLDIAKIQQQEDKNTWQYIKCSDYLYEDIYNINYYTYNKDDNLLEKAKEDYERKLKYFKDNNWQYFVNIEKENIQNKIKELETTLLNTNDKEEKQKLNQALKNLKNDLIIINYRLNNQISYSNTYLNQVLLDYKENLSKKDNYQNKNLTYQEKIDYNNILKTINIDEYIIKNKQNINKQNTLNYQLRTIVDDYELFIIIIILISASILIGEEFNKGTIKLLLIKPYKRSKILLSKYLASLLVILFTILFIILSELIIGGLFLGFDSLSIPTVVYNFTSSKIELFNIFTYMLIRILTKLPLLIMIQTIAFTLGIILNNTIATFSITILLYTFSEVINNLIINYKLKFMSLFITMNWNFKDYLFGGLSTFEYINLKKSILIYLIYVIILMGIMFISFNKKNIKNV